LKRKLQHDYYYTIDQRFAVCWLVASTESCCVGALLSETKENRVRKTQGLKGLPVAVFPENGFYRTAGIMFHPKEDCAFMAFPGSGQVIDLGFRALLDSVATSWSSSDVSQTTSLVRSRHCALPSSFFGLAHLLFGLGGRERLRQSTEAGDSENNHMQQQ
jgi:hypothetical protein